MRIIQQDNYIRLSFENKVDYKLYEQFDKIQSVDINNLRIVYLDFSLTNFISLSGAIYIIYFLNYFKDLNILYETRIISIDKSIATILAKYGFFKCAKFYCNLHLDVAIEEINKKILRDFALDNIHNQSSIYWPIKTIPLKSGNYFEADDSGFTNSFIDYFNLIIQQGKLKSFESSIDDIRKGFIKTVYELGKNIWEHSDSWGISAIQSTDKTKTTLALCDYGVGFIGSYMARNPQYIRNLSDDRKLIEWLLKEGNSSKAETKNGHGLSRVLKFTTLVNGILLIKTDNFEITFKGNQDRLEVKNTKYFKGTQVFINF